MPQLTPASQAVIDEFGQQPGVTADQFHNLRAAIAALRVLPTPFNDVTVRSQSSSSKPVLHRRVLWAIATVTLSLGAHAETSNTPPNKLQEATAVSTDAALAPPSRYTAEQALRHVLDLIRTSQSVADLTPERLGFVMGVPVMHWGRGYGYGFEEDLTPQWLYRFSVSNVTISKGQERSRFELGFYPTISGSSPPMSDICQLDFDQFAAELEAMGFKRDSIYDSPPYESPLSHGGLMYDHFQRPGKGSGLRIQVYPEGEAHSPHEKISHKCVSMIQID